jgi:hypothetical protein
VAAHDPDDAATSDPLVEGIVDGVVVDRLEERRVRVVGQPPVPAPLVRAGVHRRRIRSRSVQSRVELGPGVEVCAVDVDRGVRGVREDDSAMRLQVDQQRPRDLAAENDEAAQVCLA